MKDDEVFGPVVHIKGFVVVGSEIAHCQFYHSSDKKKYYTECTLKHSGVKVVSPDCDTYELGEKDYHTIRDAMFAASFNNLRELLH